MARTHGETRRSHPARQRVSLAIAIGVTVPGVWLRFTVVHPPDVVAALAYGLAIVGAAFLLSWAAEVAQLDISAGLAIAVLAFIAVLPEYAVDMVFASKGGNAVQAFGTACKAPGASGERVLARAREHDRREPAADRPRLVDGRVHRVAPGSSAKVA